jgi:predicted peptidase
MFLDKVEEIEDDGLHASWIQTGAGMMIQGCSSRMSRFNYQVGTVLGRRRDRRVAFKLPDCQGGTVLYLRPRNLVPLEKGSIVEITGLASNATLNGITGTVIELDYEKIRYVVRLPATEHHAQSVKAVRATKVVARTRLWDLDVTFAPTYLQWRKEQDSLFVDSQGYHRRFGVHLPLRFATAGRETGTSSLIRWPLLVYMHGAGGSSFLRHSKKSLQSTGLNQCAENFVVVSPHCDWNWKDRPKPWVNELVVALRAAEWIDHQRIYLTGCSMGGMGTWEVGAERPDLYAALAPVAAHHSAERTEHIARRLRCTPVFVIHSLDDGVCPHAKEVPLWTLLREEGNERLKVSLAQHVEHSCMFERAYCDDATLYEWFLKWCTPQD